MSSNAANEMRPFKGPVESLMIMLKDGPQFLMVFLAVTFFVLVGLIIGLRSTQASPSSQQLSANSQGMITPVASEMLAAPSAGASPTSISELGRVIAYTPGSQLGDVSVGRDLSGRSHSFIAKEQVSPPSHSFKATLPELISALKNSEPSQHKNFPVKIRSTQDFDQLLNRSDNVPQSSLSTLNNQMAATESRQQQAVPMDSEVSIAPSRKAQVGQLIAAYEETKNEAHLLQLFDLWKKRPGDNELFDVFTTYINKKEDIVWVEKIYLQAVEYNSTSTLVHRRWAGFYYQKNLLAIANKILAEKYDLAKRREDSNYLHLYAAVQSKLGNHELENTVYHDLREIQPGQWRWQLAVAQNYEKTGRFPQSEAAYQKLMAYRDVPNKVRDFAQSMLVQLAQDY